MNSNVNFVVLVIFVGEKEAAIVSLILELASMKSSLFGDLSGGGVGISEVKILTTILQLFI